MKSIAFDTETFPLGLTGKTNTNPVPALVCATFYDGKNATIKRDVDAVETWLEMLRDPATKIIGHSLTYDMLVMLRAAWDLLGVDVLPEVFAAYEIPDKMHDTKIRQQLIDIATCGLFRRGGYDLASFVKHYLGEDITASKTGTDVWRLRYNELAPYPTEVWPAAAVEYAINDAKYTWEVWNAQHSETYGDYGTIVADATGVQNADFQTRADFALALMSSWGIRVDVEFATELLERYQTRAAELCTVLQSLGVIRPDKTTDTSVLKSLYARAFRECGLQVERTPTGDISTAKSARSLLEEAGYKSPWFAASVEHARVTDYITTYMEAILQAQDYAMCSRYGALVGTGRTSSSGPNMQNFPKRDQAGETIASSLVRRCFVPRAGNVFVNADWAAAELRTLAQVNLNLGHHPVRMAESLQAGRDLHLAVGAEILGITYDEAHERRKEPEVARARQVAKIANFGFPGGLQPGGFVAYARGYGVEVPAELSQTIFEHWKSQWPEMVQYFGHIRRSEKHRSYPVQQHGPMRSGNWRTRNCEKFTSACNTLFQGATADGAKMALWVIQRECYTDPQSPLYGFRCNAFVHDEFLLEGPKERAQAAANRLCEIMISEMSKMTPDVPVEVDVDIGTHWGDNDVTFD